MPQKQPKNSRFMEPLAMAVACGARIKDAAASAGCSIDTAYRLSRSEPFRERINTVRAEALQSSIGRLTESTSKAAATLVALLDNDDPKIQLAAATRLFATITPLTELHDLRRDRDELRESMKGTQGRAA